MKKKYILVLTATIALLGVSCTKNFEVYNRDQAGLTDEELSRTPVGGQQLQELMNWIIPNQENGYQMSFDLLGEYSGFAGGAVHVGDFSRYSPRVGWNDYPFDDTFSQHLYPQYRVLEQKAEGDINEPYYALGKILRTAIVHWVSDIYGAVPYSQVKEGQIQAPYDTMEELYTNMLQDIKASAEALELLPAGYDRYKAFDVVYGGDMKAWARYARSLALRMSVRISGVAPTMAKEYAEWAVANGVIGTNAENAEIASIDNPAYKVSKTWANSRAGADIVEYLKAFDDPRLGAYFTEISGRSTKFMGLHTPTTKPDGLEDTYSLPNIKMDSPVTLITAAEVAFLKAEGVLLGWNMGGQTAQEFYEEGIKLSCEQWGVAVGDYLSVTSTRGAFTDELVGELSMPDFKSDITVSWETAEGDIEKQKAKIITQKWIALYPYNILEAWSEWRRTGYPNLLPAVVNSSGGVVQDITQVDGRDTGGMRRLKYPASENEQNRENLQKAINDLGGSDNYGTDLWWAKR